MQEFLSPAEVAKLLGLPKTSVWKQCREGGLPHVKIGRNIRIKRTDLDAWFEGGKQTKKAS